MRLDALAIGEFKNLRNLEIDFDEDSPYTVLVGENGTGKSNLIEALTLIFRNLDLDLSAPFDYRLRYRCRGHDVQVEAEKDQTPKFGFRRIGTGGYADLSKRRFMDEDGQGKPHFRPAFVFGYYSGPSDRLASLYEEHRRRYYRLIIQPQAKRAVRPVDSNALRRLFYAQTLPDSSRYLLFS